MSAACPLQLEHRHELLAHSLELLFRSLLVGNVQRVCLAHASQHGALSRYSDGFERVIHSVKFRVHFQERSRTTSVHNPLACHESFEYPPALRQIDC